MPEGVNGDLGACAKVERKAAYQDGETRKQPEKQEQRRYAGGFRLSLQPFAQANSLRTCQLNQHAKRWGARRQRIQKLGVTPSSQTSVTCHGGLLTGAERAWPCVRGTYALGSKVAIAVAT